LLGRTVDGMKRATTTLVLLGATVALLAPLRVAAHATGSPSLALDPSVARRGHAAVIVVHNLDRARGVEVRLNGATEPSGTPLPWQRLRFVRRAWRGVLVPPALRGVYPIELRVSGGSLVRSRQWLFRVLAPGTLARPTFATPEQVAYAWVTTSAHGRLLAVKRWPAPAFDRRDPRLHQLLVVSYRPPGASETTAPLGMFVTAVRLSYGEPWRLLEATVAP
jgi:hypothetical protein